jgi:hypothetical protein
MFMIKLFNKNIKNYVWSLLFFWTTWKIHKLYLL